MLKIDEMDYIPIQTHADLQEQFHKQQLETPD